MNDQDQARGAAPATAAQCVEAVLKLMPYLDEVERFGFTEIAEPLIESYAAARVAEATAAYGLTPDQLQAVFEVLERCDARERDLAEVVHRVQLLVNRECAVCRDGRDVCRSCEANMEVPIPKQVHHENCEIGQALGEIVAYFEQDRLDAVTLLLQLREAGIYPKAAALQPTPGGGAATEGQP